MGSFKNLRILRLSQKSLTVHFKEGKGKYSFCLLGHFSASNVANDFYYFLPNNKRRAITNGLPFLFSFTSFDDPGGRISAINE